MHSLRFYFYPQWNCEKAEEWLSDMENGGQRLTGVYFYWWFRFTKSQPKKTRYFFCYNFFKETPMYECERWLKSACGANEIKERNTFNPTIYRVTSNECDLTELYPFRQKYIRHVLVQKILLALMFLVLGALLCITSVFPAESGIASFLLSLCVMVPSGMAIIWYLYGLWYLHRHVVR